ncbi:MAG: AAA family ATPase [Desulfobacterales bacterium]|nr:AAA family ATPase [Desulfobacterales bacterium]
MTSGKYELSADALRSICDPKKFSFRSTAEIQPLEGVIGQKRAVQAIEFGLEMNSAGYNICVTGAEGTGKKTIVSQIAGEHAKRRKPSVDWCLVNNFRDEYRPVAVAVPTGRASYFSRKMAKIIEGLQKTIPEAFAGEVFLKKKADIQKKHARRQSRLLSRIEAMAAEKNIHVSQSDTGLGTVVLKEGEPMSREQFEALSAEERKRIEKNLRLINHELEDAARKISRIGQSLHEEIEKLVDAETRTLLRQQFTPLREEFRELAPVLAYLDAVEQDIVENVQDFVLENGGPAEGGKAGASGIDSTLKRYEVNVLVDRSGQRGAPVIYESNPTYTNLFGQIEKRAVMGSMAADFTMVQAGSLLKADGGYLILEIDPVLTNNFVWDALKRTLQNDCLAIEDMASELGYISAFLRPEPIPVDVKVILIGSPWPFQLLQEADSKMSKIFKVRADFDDEVDRSDQTEQQYAGFIARVCRQEGLLPFTNRGVAAIVEFGQKAVADTRKLSLRFGPIMALLEEADHWARKRNGRAVTDRDVFRAFKEHHFRYNLVEEKVQQAFADGTLLMDVDGEEVGQVNALSVYQVGGFSFGRPTRVTAEVFMGRKGMINIEREAQLSGSTHDKGVLILSGCLGRIFARRFPLALSISLTFEQSYDEIDGDSASSTELYAIVSSLAEAPIRQGIAVTGSVNQKGKIQAIGGVNKKIEGYFDVCSARGLTGRQGVIIPRANENNLMLRRDVVEAVRDGKFHIYRVETVEQGLEILTGETVGMPDAEGRYDPATLYGRAQQKLEGYARRSMRMRTAEGEGENDLPTAC